jgi:lipoprotein-anchoring transpeptidase ErfK/SrfK
MMVCSHAFLFRDLGEIFLKYFSAIILMKTFSTSSKDLSMGSFSLHLPITVILSFLSAGTLLHANLNPMAILNGQSHRHHVKKPAKKKVIRWVASKRSLSSYGRMKHEYIGPVHNSPAISGGFDPDVYTHHTPTNNPYLEAKAIDGPLPQDYSKLFLKAKTLLDPTRTHLKVVVNKSIQRIFVYKDLEHLYTFKSSTGKAGHRTPAGTFKPYSLELMHYSRKYYNSPMPWSVFFNGGVAIHGTEAIWNLGHAASHGCVRTHPVSARRIYNLVRKYGTKNTTVIVTN